MKTFICSLLLILSVSAMAKTIVCNDVADQDAGVDGKIVIKTDAQGKMVSLKANRQSRAADEEYEAVMGINLSFDAKTARFDSGTKKNTIDNIDEDTKEPTYSWGIENVKFFNAYNPNGDSVEITLDDHLYSGTPGSSVIYKQNGETSAAQWMLFCK